MLFWKMIDLNKVRLWNTPVGARVDVYLQRFRAFLSDSGKTSDIVGYIVLCCLELKDNPGKPCRLGPRTFISSFIGQHNMVYSACCHTFSKPCHPTGRLDLL